LFVFTTICKECVKVDVCNKKDEFNNATNEIRRVNTSKDNGIMFVKDDPNIEVKVKCMYYLAKSINNQFR